MDVVVADKMHCNHECVKLSVTVPNLAPCKKNEHRGTNRKWFTYRVRLISFVIATMVRILVSDLARYEAKPK